MLGLMLRGRDSIWFGLVLMAWHGGGCVFAAACKYSARHCDDAERVARVYGECARRIRRLQSIAAHSFRLILITVGTHTDARVADSRAGFNLILLGLDGLA